MSLRRAALFFVFKLAASQPSPVDFQVDWPSFLARHDPIWRFNLSCSSGYTVLNSTIKHEGACPGVQCPSVAACPDLSASACDACPACTSFGLSPQWRGGMFAQLFGNTTPYINNSGWTTWAKGGSALPTHHSCGGASGIAVAWEDAAWLGNGLQGLLLRGEPGQESKALRLDVGRVDVWDRRPGSGPGGEMFDKPRLPVGYALLTFAGDIVRGGWRVALHEGVLRGSVSTTLGAVNFTLLTHATRNVHALAWEASGGEAPQAGSGEGGAVVAFFPIQGNSTRHSPPPAYLPNPPFACGGGSGWGGAPRVCAQPLLAGAGYATALVTVPLQGAPANSYVTVLHTANDWPVDTSAATAASVAAAQAAAMGAAGGWQAAVAEQGAWWAGFWGSGSFLSVPDTAVEAAWVLQMAKVGSATRAGGGAMDLMGPWWQPSGWELFWWDMNMPVTYWPLYASGRFDLAATLTNFLLSNVSQLAANTVNHSDTYSIGGASSYDLAAPVTIAPNAMLGNFPWICHNLFSHASFTGNATMMRDVVFPLLRGAVNVYRAFAFEGPDGLLHLPPSYSPEYPYPHGPTNDTHYDLALFAWGSRTLLSLAARFNISDPLAAYWARVGTSLAPYPTDAVHGHGFNVSLGVGFDVPHRHFSHLFALFPLHNVAHDDADGGSAASRALFAASLDRWTGLTCGGQLSACPNGFTYDGAASISALMGASLPARAEDAAGYLHGFVHSGLMHASTSYSEGHQPCLESPLGMASSLMDLLLTSWGGRLRPFPSAPPSWREAVFWRLAGEGGWRVSAARSGGATVWVALTAEPADAGGATQVVATVAPGSLAPPYATAPPGVAVEVLPTGDLRFAVPVGGTVVVFTGSAGTPPPPFDVAPLVGNVSEYNFWGKH